MPFTVLDARSFQRLNRLVGAKASAVSLLISILASGKYPLTHLNEAEWSEMLSPDDLTFEKRTMLVKALRTRNGVDLRGALDEPARAALADYLEARQPSQQLEHIRSAAEELYEAIVENFSIKEVLLHVADHGSSANNTVTESLG